MMVMTMVMMMSCVTRPKILTRIYGIVNAVHSVS